MYDEPPTHAKVRLCSFAELTPHETAAVNKSEYVTVILEVRVAE